MQHLLCCFHRLGPGFYRRTFWGWQFCDCLLYERWLHWDFWYLLYCLWTFWESFYPTQLQLYFRVQNGTRWGPGPCRHCGRRNLGVNRLGTLGVGCATHLCQLRDRLGGWFCHLVCGELYFREFCIGCRQRSNYGPARVLVRIILGVRYRGSHRLWPTLQKRGTPTQQRFLVYYLWHQTSYYRDVGTRSCHQVFTLVRNDSGSCSHRGTLIRRDHHLRGRLRGRCHNFRTPWLFCPRHCPCHGTR